MSKDKVIVAEKERQQKYKEDSVSLIQQSDVTVHKKPEQEAQ